jgi:hypothetical protein
MVSNLESRGTSPTSRSRISDFGAKRLSETLMVSFCNKTQTLLTSWCRSNGTRDLPFALAESLSLGASPFSDKPLLEVTLGDNLTQTHNCGRDQRWFETKLPFGQQFSSSLHMSFLQNRGLDCGLPSTF